MIGSRDLSRMLSVVAVAVGLTGVATPAVAEQRLITEVGAWRAIEAVQGDRRYCFVIAVPPQRTPPELKRDPGSFFVSLRPKSKGGGTEASIEFGYPLTPTGNVISVGDEGFALVPRHETAWLAQESDEPRLLEAMRAGLDLRVAARSARGNRTTDVYGLKGFSAALAELQKRCRP